MVSMQEIQAAYEREAAMSAWEFDEMMRHAPGGASPAQQMEMAYLAEVTDQIAVPGEVQLSLPVALHSFFEFDTIEIGAGY